MDITLRTEEEPEPPMENEMKKIRSIVENPNLGIEDVCKHLLRIHKPVLQELHHQLGGVPLRDQLTDAKSKGKICKSDIIDAITQVQFENVRSSPKENILDLLSYSTNCL